MSAEINIERIGLNQYPKISYSIANLNGVLSGGEFERFTEKLKKELRKVKSISAFAEITSTGALTIISYVKKSDEDKIKIIDDGVKNAVLRAVNNTGNVKSPP